MFCYWLRIGVDVVTLKPPQSHTERFFLHSIFQNRIKYDKLHFSFFLLQKLIHFLLGHIIVPCYKILTHSPSF